MEIDRVTTTTSNHTVVNEGSHLRQQNTGAMAYSDYVKGHLEQKENSVNKKKQGDSFLEKQLDTSPAAQVQISEFGKTRMKEYQKAREEQEENDETKEIKEEQEDSQNDMLLLKGIDKISEWGERFIQYIVKTGKGILNAFRGLVKVNKEETEEKEEILEELDDDFEVNTIEGGFDISVDGEQIQKNVDGTDEFIKEFVKEQAKADPAGKIDIRI